MILFIVTDLRNISHNKRQNEGIFYSSLRGKYCYRGTLDSMNELAAKYGFRYRVESKIDRSRWGLNH